MIDGNSWFLQYRIITEDEKLIPYDKRKKLFVKLIQMGNINAEAEYPWCQGSVEATI